MQESLQQILEQQMRDVQSPESVAWWPLAIGWWLLFALLITTTVLFMIALIRHRQRNRYRRLALIELQAAFDDWRQHADVAVYLQRANNILKRSVLHFTPDNNFAARLSGESWLTHLNQYVRHPLSAETQAALATLCYQVRPRVAVESVHTELIRWLKTHKGLPVADAASRSNAEAQHA